ncbi:hypothetical protein HPB47_020844 [Ixodes persulcatus]|uniref:Uncharacterized protein n=1 Tax=Ixodes persulcatus TaxID=34615 RepID=A0AC60QHK5_IXOPE|nr:hypothetical protein HPB47_020844 [Ixodes persulcatus]
MSEQYSSDEEACICNGEVLVNHKRKETHNVVERRRKDKINVNILRLGDLLPDKDPKKQSKNGILERASDYIVYLKDLNEKLVMEKASDMEDFEPFLDFESDDIRQTTGNQLGVGVRSPTRRRTIC